MAKNQTLADVIKAVKFHFGLNQAEIAEKTGIKLTYLSDLIGGRNPLSESYSDKLNTVFGVNKDYLRTGVGDMFTKHVKNTFEYSIGGNEIKPTAELSGKPPYETYLLPLSAMGGPLSGFAADSVTLANCEKIVSPIEDVDFAITIYGESMYPKYPSGARLLIKKINPDIFIDWGKAYVLDTSNGVIVKEVRMSDREGCIACHSINPDPKFRPFDVPLSEVYGMYRVLMSLSAE